MNDAPPRGNGPPIDHVVVLMMENACFDRMLGALAEVHPGLDGVDPANPRGNPDGFDGTTVAQAPTTTRNVHLDPKHFVANALAQIDNGRNEGFINDFVRTHPASTAADRREVMAYYPRGFLPALHCLAETFVVADHWFSSLPGPTWMNRLFAHSGTSLGQIDEPGGLFCSGLHLFNERTLYDELGDSGRSWRIYFGDVPQSLVLTRQWRHLGNYRRFRHWRDDVAAGDLPDYTFIEPTYFGPNQNDQHPPHDIMRGDALIADVYNALRANPGLFARTLLIVLYDEHGGFYDHVPPPATVAPDEHIQHFGFDVLGLRVPALLISPLLDPGVITPVYDHTSLLRMAANLWPGVRPLGRRAEAANDPLAAVTWRATPRTDLPEAPVAPDIRPVEPIRQLQGFKASLFGLSHHVESRIAHPVRRLRLRRRRHETLAGGHQQGMLATDRIAAFLTSPGLLRWVFRRGRR